MSVLITVAIVALVILGYQIPRLAALLRRHSRLAAWGGAALALVVLLMPITVSLVHVLRWGHLGGDAAAEQTTIRQYDADFTVAADGRMRAVEDLAIRFPDSSHHGIFRFWDVADPQAPHQRRVPSDISVTRDGTSEEYTEYTQGGGRYQVARIGDPDLTVDEGDHRYTISYDMQDALGPRAGGSAFYWNLIPGGWAQRIQHGVLTVHLPSPVTGPVACDVGWGRQGGCEATGAGSDTLRIEVSDLPPDTPVTVRATLDPPPPQARVDIPWSARWDRVVGDGPDGRSARTLAFWLLGGLLVGLLLALGTWERRVRTPVTYAPPEGIGPAQAAYVVDERLSAVTFVATLMHAAERGHLTLSKHGDGWKATGARGAPALDSLDPITAAVVASIARSPLDVQRSRKSGKRMRAMLEAFERSVRDWAEAEGLVRRVRVRWLILPLAIPLTVASLVLSIILGMRGVGSLFGLAPALAAVGALAWLPSSAGSRRTAKATPLRSRAGGFKRMLATPSAEDRFDFSARTELYTAYIPWAVAFACADQWAEKYHVETGEEPPVPTYVVGNVPTFGADGHHSVGTAMATSFSVTAGAAISAYAISQAASAAGSASSSSSSSGGGGGGDFGGGGGGGGGGGSW